MANTTSTTLATTITTGVMAGLHRMVAVGIIEPTIFYKGVPKGQSGVKLNVYSEAPEGEDKTEGTDYTTTSTLSTTANTLTPAERIIRFDVTDKAKAQSIDDIDREVFVQGGESMQLKIDAILRALFSGFSTTVAGAGTELTTATFELAKQYLVAAKAPGPHIFMTGPKGYWGPKGVSRKVFGISENYGLMANGASENLIVNGFQEMLMGFKVIVNPNITIDGNGDITSAFYSQKAMAWGVQESYPFRAEVQRDASNTLSEVVFSIMAGGSEYYDSYGVTCIHDVS